MEEGVNDEIVSNVKTKRELLLVRFGCCSSRRLPRLGIRNCISGIGFGPVWNSRR